MGHIDKRPPYKLVLDSYRFNKLLTVLYKTVANDLVVKIIKYSSINDNNIEMRFYPDELLKIIVKLIDVTNEEELGDYFSVLLKRYKERSEKFGK